MFGVRTTSVSFCRSNCQTRKLNFYRAVGQTLRYWRWTLVNDKLAIQTQIGDYEPLT